MAESDTPAPPRQDRPSTTSAPPGSAPQTVANPIAEAAARFAAAWDRDTPPDPNDYLPPDPADPAREAIAAELARIDREYRAAGHLRPTIHYAPAAPGTPENVTIPEVIKPAVPGLPIGPSGYELTGELGRGGMGVVYRATHLRLGRVVAMKMVLGAGQASPGELLRFLGEAQAVAAIRHPHVLQVFDSGENAGQPFLVMEYLSGGSLADRLQTQKRLNPRSSAAMVAKIARGVAAAHALGIVHRDLKPANVLLDDAGEPKVADFGLAKRGAGTDLTVTGVPIGTPAYMAPEQARGEAKFVGPPADVWALGVILYECLTGNRPFVAEGVHGMIRRVIETDPEPPRSRDPAIPRDLDVVCLKCLEKEPHRRYPDAAALAADLDRFLAGEPVSARPVSFARRAAAWLRKRPAVVVGLLAAVILGYTITTLLLARARDAHRARVDNLHERVLSASPEEVPVLRTGADPYLADLRPRLVRVVTDDSASPRERLNAALLVGTDDPVAIEHLRARLAELPATEVRPVVAVLCPAVREDPGSFWAVAEDTARSSGVRLRFAAALAAADPDNLRWNAVTEDLVVAILFPQSAGDMSVWAKLFAPVRPRLEPAVLRAMAADREGDAGTLAAALLAELSGDRKDVLAGALEPASFRQAGMLTRHFSGAPNAVFERLRERANQANGWQPGLRHTNDAELDSAAAARARAAFALLASGRGTDVWPLFEEKADPRLRTVLIHQAPAAGIDPELLARELDATHSASVRQALLMTLGEYLPQRLPAAFVGRVSRKAAALYETDPAPGVHSAAAWLLRTWGRGNVPTELDRRLVTPGPVPGRDWYATADGTTFAIVHGPVEVATGSPAGEGDRDWTGGPKAVMGSEDPTRWLIPRSYAIATTEVTAAQCRQMLTAIAGPNLVRTRTELCAAIAGGAVVPELDTFWQTFLPLWSELRPPGTRYFPEPACPTGGVTYRLAMCYCRWLGEQEGIPEEEQCYPPIADIIRRNARPRSDYLNRTGYRLPTEAEWEHACRAGTRTPFPFGADSRLADKYGWHQATSPDRSQPVGRLKPNGFGLFDVMGNAAEWCHGRLVPTFPPPGAASRLDDGLDEAGAPLFPHIIRGGAFAEPRGECRVAHRLRIGLYESLERSYGSTGMRLVRTVRPAAPSRLPARAKVREVFTVRVEGTGPFQVKETFGPVAVEPKAGKLPAELTVQVDVPPGWVRQEVSFVLDAPDMRERLWIGREEGGGPLRIVPQRVNSVGLAFSLIPAGEFEQGTPEWVLLGVYGRAEFDLNALLRTETPPRRVRLPKPFGLGTTEVTVGAFRRFADAAKYVGEDERGPKNGTVFLDGKWQPQNGRTWRTFGDLTDEHPVQLVTYTDSVRFCEWLTTSERVQYRLPTEAEWEYAARGGTVSLWPWGNDLGRVDEYAWYRETDKQVQPVGRKRPNQFGLHDTLGNAMEWCADGWNENAYVDGPVADPRVRWDGKSSLVRRGGHLPGRPGDMRPGGRYHEGASGVPGFRVVCGAWEPRLRGVVGTPRLEFLPPGGGDAIPLAFDAPAKLPPFVLVPTWDTRSSPYWLAYPRPAPRGEAVTAFGCDTAATWTVRYLDWREPLEPAAWYDRITGAELFRETRSYPGYGPHRDWPLPLRDRSYGVIMTAEPDLAPGIYEFVVTSGCGNRVWAGETEVLSTPTMPHLHSNRGEIAWKGGRAPLRVETFNLRGDGNFVLHIRLLRPLDR